MKKNSKVLVSIALIFCILAFLGTYYFLYIDNDSPKKEEEKKLSGEKLTDGLYQYNLNIGERDYNVTVVNNTIYYMIVVDNKYEFYKTDIYTNKKEKIGEHDSKDYYCYFESTYIDCSNDNKKIMYDYNFKTIYDGENKVVLPYKDDLIKIEKNIAYYKDKEYKKLNKDFTGLNMYNYESFDDNIYIFFTNIEDDCLLNLEENKCEEYKYTSIKKYPNGLYYIDGSKIHIIDINNKNFKDYNKPIDDNFLTNTQLKDNKLYYYSSEYLRIYNLESNKVSMLDYRLKNGVNSVYLTDNLLSLVSSDVVYFIDLNKLSLDEMTMEELNTKIEKKLTDKLEKIKNDYNVDIKVRKDADLNFTSTKEKVIGETDYSKIIDSLEASEELFSIFGKEFFNEFIHDEYKGLNVYLASDIKSSFSQNGSAFRYYNNYAIVARSEDYKRTMCHELMHTLEDAAITKKKKIFEKWFDYNPKGFEYGLNYNEYDPARKYTANYGKGDVYFIDNYSQLNDNEDKARIFENMCMNTVDVIKKNPMLLKKAEYLEEEVIKYYPMLKDSVIFDSIKQ